MFLDNKVYHGEEEHRFNISTQDLKEGDSIGCCITRDGDWEIYIDGQKRAVGWHNVPTDKPLWGVVDILGIARTIQSEFYCGEIYSESLRLQCVKHTILMHTYTETCMHSCTHTVHMHTTYSMCYPVC